MLSRLGIDVRRGEAGLLAGLSGYFFFLIASYYTIKPATRSLVMEELGARWLPAFVALSALLIGAVVVLVQTLVDRTSRRVLLSGTALVFAACLLGFYALFRSGTHPEWTAALFYLWADIFSIVSVTLYWSFANDLCTPDQGKRLFGLLGAGGQIGSLLGAYLAARLAPRIGTEQLIPISAVLLMGTVPLVLALDGLARRRTARRPDGHPPPPPPAATGEPADTGPLAGVRLILSSRYLMLITAILGLSLMASQFVEQQFNLFVEGEVLGKDARTRYLGRRDALMGVLSLGMQAFLTAPILKRLGFTVALLLMPSSDLVTGLALLAWPGLGLSLTAKVADACLKYGITQVSKETLYLPMTRDVKYKAKAFIDMFFYRFAKGVAAIFILGVVAMPGVEPRELSVPVVLLCGLWIAAVLALRRRYVEELEGRVDGLARRLGTPASGPDRDLVVGMAAEVSDGRLVTAYDLAVGPDAEGRAIGREYLEQVLAGPARSRALALIGAA